MDKQSDKFDAIDVALEKDLPELKESLDLCQKRITKVIET